MNWISVEDSLPYGEEDIFIYWRDEVYRAKFCNMVIGKYMSGECFIFYALHDDKWKRHTVYHPEGMQPVTHWMPFPEPPTKGE